MVISFGVPMDKTIRRGCDRQLPSSPLARPLKGSDHSPGPGRPLHPPGTSVGGDRTVRLSESSALSNTGYNVYWNNNYTASEYAFDTTRKSGPIAEAILAGGAYVALV